MMRRSLVAAVAAAPLLLALGAAAHAATAVSGSTSGTLTSTVASGQPGDVDVASGATLSPSDATKPAITIDSSNKVTVEGTISFTDANGATGILVNGGNTGSVTNTGTISLTQTYSATDSNADGVNDGVFSKLTGGYGIRQVGGTFTGDIDSTGVITVQANSAVGISIEGTLNGQLDNVLITPASGSTAATASNGSVTVLGDNAIGVSIAKTGHVTGNVTLGSVSATGVGATGVSILGGVDGALILNGGVVVTAYRTTSPSSFTTAIQATFTADEMQQSGSAVVIGADIAKGVTVAAVPLAPTDSSVTAPTDADGNGIPDASQGGSITVYGGAPAVQIGVTGTHVTVGGAQATDGSAYGFVNEGSITASGIFDQTSEPNLPAPVSTTAIRIGVSGDATAVATLDNGFLNTSSAAVTASAVDANSTAIDVATGGSVSRVVNNGSIQAVTTINNLGTSQTTLPAADTAQAILVEQGGTLSSLTNTKSITAVLTGSIDATNPTNVGSAYAIRDKSGTLLNVANSGAISAVVTQTVTGTAPSTGAVVTTPTAVAIDLSAATQAETITQTQGPDYVQGTTATAATAPTIVGDIRFGAGDDTLNVKAGTVTGAISFGAGNNTLIIDGSATAATGETTPRVTSVTGAITDTGGTLTVDLGRGQLSVTNADTIAATAVNVSANGTLYVAADPANNKNTDFVTTGNSTIAAGATFGLTMLSLQTNLSQQYTIMQTALDSGGVKQGSISASTFGAGQLANSPYLFSSTASYQQGTTTSPDEIILTVTRKTAAQLGFNTAESQAYDQVFNALLQDSDIQKAILAQTTKSGLITVYDQMLPDQGQGVFDTLDQATQSVASLTAQTPDAGTRIAGTSLWLQEVNERVKRRSGDTLGSQSQLFGLVGGWEHMGAGGGALGLTFSYLNVQDRDSAAAVGEHTVGSLLEIGGYYRRAIGGLRVSARGAGGYAFFNEDRQLVYTGVSRRALSSWGGYFADAHVGAEYEVHLGRFYARPGVSADYLYLRENGHTETGGGNGFDLAIDPRASHRLSGEAILTLGTQFGRATWLRTEVSGGYRRIFSGDMGDTTARFTSSSTPFTLTGMEDKGGWFTVGFSLKGGTNLSYLALEGDADFRDGEQRYNLFLSGRSMF